MTLVTQISHADIAARIPHQGAMCLLDRVTLWDETQVRATAHSHRDLNNPLRAENRLGIAAGIEYAAQAMAVHGALIALLDKNDTNAPRVGYLASVRGVELHVARLDDIPSDLHIAAQRMSGDERNVLYAFEIHADDKLLLRGRATVILDAENKI